LCCKFEIECLEQDNGSNNSCNFDEDVFHFEYFLIV
jgi:hypothetical protein